MSPYGLAGPLQRYVPEVCLAAVSLPLNAHRLVLGPLRSSLHLPAFDDSGSQTTWRHVAGAIRPAGSSAGAGAEADGPAPGPPPSQGRRRTPLAAPTTTSAAAVVRTARKTSPALPRRR